METWDYELVQRLVIAAECIDDNLARIAACMEKAEERSAALVDRSIAMMEKGMAMAERTEAELDNL